MEVISAYVKINIAYQNNLINRHNKSEGSNYFQEGRMAWSLFCSIRIWFCNQPKALGSKWLRKSFHPNLGQIRKLKSIQASINVDYALILIYMGWCLVVLSVGGERSAEKRTPPKFEAPSGRVRSPSSWYKLESPKGQLEVRD